MSHSIPTVFTQITMGYDNYDAHHPRFISLETSCSIPRWEYTSCLVKTDPEVLVYRLIMSDVAHLVKPLHCNSCIHTHRLIRYIWIVTSYLTTVLPPSPSTTSFASPRVLPASHHWPPSLFESCSCVHSVASLFLSTRERLVHLWCPSWSG